MTMENNQVSTASSRIAVSLTKIWHVSRLKFMNR